MFGYTMVQWVFFFYLYSFLGWCWETAFVSIRSRKFVNRGFLRGPFLPLYGTGALMLLIITRPFAGRTFLVYIVGCVGATLLELVTGIVMEALFKVRYWDYSNKKFNYKGYICLTSSIAWGFFTIAMTKWIHPPLEAWVLSIPLKILTPITFVLTVFLAVDFALSFKAALDLRDVLAKIDDVKADLMRMQKRLDVIIAVANDETRARREERKEKNSVRLEDLTENLRARFDQLRGRRDQFSDRMDAWDEITALRARFREDLANGDVKTYIRRFYTRDQLRSNPSIASRKFADALDFLKKAAAQYRKSDATDANTEDTRDTREQIDHSNREEERKENI